MKWNAFSLFTPAFDRMQKILFPIDFRYWFKLGFVSAFSVGGSLGGGGGGRSSFPGSMPISTNSTTRNITGNAISNYSEKGILWGILGALALLASIVLLILTFISSIFSFIFIDALVKKKFTIRDGWKKHYSKGVSFFWFRILVGFISLAVTVIIFLPFIISLFRAGFVDYFTQTSLLSIFIDLLPSFIVFILWWAVLSFFLMLVYDFAIMEQYFHAQSTKSALQKILRSVKHQKGETAVYTLAKIVFKIGTGIIAGIVGIIYFLIALLLGVGIFLLFGILSKIFAWIILFIYAVIAICIFIIALLPLNVFLRVFSLLAYVKLAQKRDQVPYIYKT